MKDLNKIADRGSVDLAHEREYFALDYFVHWQRMVDPSDLFVHPHERNSVYGEAIHKWSNPSNCLDSTRACSFPNYCDYHRNTP